MKKAILHIGCEKTGSTSIQSHLYSHRYRLRDDDYTYYESAGLISNHKLVIFAHSRPDQDLLDLAGVQNTAESIQKFKREFIQEHTEAVNVFHRNHPSGSTAVYSSEHCQSRLTREEDIAFLKRFLDDLYDSVEVVVYIRRQDKYASSAHNTAIQGGNTNRFSFENVHAGGVYYDYYSMLELWASVFGQSAITARVFDPSRLHQKSVVADFCKHIGWSDDEKQHEEKRTNERLSYSAQEALLAFNRVEANHSVLRGHTKASLRQDLITELHSWNDSHGSIRPSRQQALDFYENFRKNNDLIAEKWLEGNGFDDNFDYYPEVAEQPPELNTEMLLDKAITQCLGIVSQEEASLLQIAGDSL